VPKDKKVKWSDGYDAKTATASDPKKLVSVREIPTERKLEKGPIL
jgi:hypothetical protein